MLEWVVRFIYARRRSHLGNRTMRQYAPVATLALARPAFHVKKGIYYKLNLVIDKQLRRDTSCKSEGIHCTFSDCSLSSNINRECPSSSYHDLAPSDANMVTIVILGFWNQRSWLGIAYARQLVLMAAFYFGILADFSCFVAHQMGTGM